jgi:hypothetical protein
VKRQLPVRVSLALPATVWICVISVLVGQGAVAHRGAVEASQRPTPVAGNTTDRVDYNWDVRPILSENCFRCHGPDEKSRMANLRLDNAESAYASLRSGATKHAIVPGQPGDSELIKRVTAETPAMRMPPRQANKTLTSEQIDILRKWIEQGATYKPHWAFLAPVKQTPPAVTFNGRQLSEIDRFTLARLQKDGLGFSPEADRETLINRVTLTLTGLPPTLREMDAFVQDKGPNAYERLVDRLLASPAYGEHMAGAWMDLARYAESDGFLDDYQDRLFWPYRDWVIAAFNKNMPFDQFSTWQLAGDLLPSHTKEQALATAFLRVGKRTTENGAIDEEYRVEYVVDRTNTVGTTFLGLTTGCARCHDHKYDPISHKDFYSLSGFFNSTDEPGFYAPGMTGVTAGPTLPWTDPATDAKLAAAETTIRNREDAYKAARSLAARAATAKAETLLRAPSDLSQTLKESVAQGLVAYYPFEETSPIPDENLPRSRPQGRRPSPPRLAPLTSGNLFGGPAGAARAGVPNDGLVRPGARASGTPPPATAERAPVETRPAAPPGGRAIARPLPSDLVRQDLVFTPSPLPGVEPAVLEAPVLREGARGKAFYFTDTNRGFLGPDVGYFERAQPFSLDLWVLPGQEYENSTVLNHRENDNNGGAGYALQLEKNHLRFDIMHSRAGNMLRVVTKQTLPVKRWTHVTVTYDGSSRAAGIAVYVDGTPAEADILRDNLTRTILVEGGGTLGDEFMGLSFGKRFRETTLKDGAIDEIRVYAKSLTPLEVGYLQDQALPTATSARADVVELLVARDRRVMEAAWNLEVARQAQNLIISVVPEIPVMGDTPTPRPTYELIRGLYTDHGDQVPPRGLNQVFPWDNSLPPNRIGLAKWLFDRKNPLTSRVFVNRLWQMHFGRGLVETSEDFGSQGTIPTHPELLDWLAVKFIESGWDIKQMQRLIVTSATFRQSSVVSDDLLKKDPRNLLLGRAPRMRMTAEMVRDAALAASGLLVKKIGGPSVYPYQPDGIWDGFMFTRYPGATEIPADDHHRRSLYSFIKRNAPHPAMATFDLPDRGVALARRQMSNTPLQALALLDDPQYVEAYRTLAAHVLREGTDDASHVTMTFRLATRRRPLPNEVAPMLAYYKEQLQRYATDGKAASELLKNGVTAADPHVDVTRLAALTNLTAVVMSTPDAYTVR